MSFRIVPSGIVNPFISWPRKEDMANTAGKYANKTDSQLKELAAALQSAADYCVQQQGQFWGQGFSEGADMFQKNGEDLASQAQAVNDEIQKRRQANMSDAEKKALKEQGQEEVSVLPPNLAPADQPTPATQPVELSTEAQKNQGQSTGGSSGTSSSTGRSNSDK